MIASTTEYVSAKTLKEIQEEKAQAEREKSKSESALESVQGDIEEIADEKAALEEEIEELGDLLFDLLLEVELLQSDVEYKKEQIAQSEIDLATAIETEEAQKTAMAHRIKYLYEKGNESYIEILIESKSMAEAVNKVEYAEKLYAYDRVMLEKYQLAKQDVIDAKIQLETDLAELEEMEEDLEIQKEQLNELIEEKKDVVEDFDSQLIKAKARASEYEKQIKQQTDNLRAINAAEQEKIAEEARLKALEEAKKRAEEAAKKKAAEEEAKRKALEEALIGDESSTTTDGSTKSSDEAKKKESTSDSITVDDSEVTDSTKTEEANTTTDTEATSSDTSTASSSTTTKTTGTTAKATGSGTGSDIANYALQFVGNPYVSGGTSLTNGCDCSGFTQTVYSDFGIKIPRSSSSQSQGGVEVAYENAQAGDIIYYGGHVAIYIGNNQIVHASTPSTGIKVSSAFYRSIISVRRYY